ncbi:DNA glycosylase AlkZ-like family protein [Isoptericola sp. NPDC056134]|uniref:DNA glycosylase AlkZ-like family protein n=1 Tax=Isoptericola sp. NPDC056134 TaxID=3345723 RepID=UPI0035ED5A3A
MVTDRAAGTPVRLTRDQARRIAVRAQLLDAHRPDDLLATVEHLMVLPVDPTTAVAPAVDLVPWSRLGRTTWPGAVEDALADRMLFRLGGTVRPTEDLPLYLEQMRRWPFGDWRSSWFHDNAPFLDDVLRLLEADGPLVARDVPDTSVRPWRSSGWTGHRNVTQMLEFANLHGDVAVCGRRGRDRLWDLAERVYPDVEPLPRAEAARERVARRVRARGITQARLPGLPGDEDHVDLAGTPATVEGTERTWLVDPAALDAVDEPFEGRTAVLSPFDALVHDRARLLEVFDFDYVLEMYKPRDRRRWGYFALPVLHGDRFVGKVDATADRKAGVLRVDAIHEDLPFDPDVSQAVRAELADLAAWLGLDDVSL